MGKIVKRDGLGCKRYVHIEELTSLEFLKTSRLIKSELLGLPKERLRELLAFCTENRSFEAHWWEPNDYGFLCEYKHKFCNDNIGIIRDAAATLFLA